MSGPDMDPRDAEIVGMDGQPYRQLPHHIEAEKAMLGALMVQNKVYDRVSDFLRPEHFAYGPHGRIYDAAVRMIERGNVADPVTLKRLFDADGDLADIGGAKYLMELANSAVGVINAGEYANMITDLARKRELIALGEELIAQAYDAGVDTTAEQIREAHEADLTKLADGAVARDTVVALADVIDPALKDIEAAQKRGGGLAGLSTGLSDLDEKMGGMGPGDLVFVAGATSMGKTAFALGIAEAIARGAADGTVDGAGPVAVFSLEMSRKQLVGRLLARRTGIGVQDLRRGNVSDAELGALAMKGNDLRALPLFIDDSGGLSVAQIRSRARRIKRRHGLALVVIDYLQLIQADTRYKGQRVNEVGEISRSLKGLAMELEVPIIALSQLSREVDRREANGHRPRKSDLRESGSLEQDGDSIIMLYRADYYTEQNPPGQKDDEDDDRFLGRLARWQHKLDQQRGKAEIIVAKNRHGPTCTVHVQFDAKHNRFGNLQQ